MAESETTAGFAPLIGRDAHTLILGSLPSVRSIASGQYYGNPQNAFWRITGELFGAGRELDYEARVARLLENRVSVWDVLHSGVRPGSMDADIDVATATVNDFSGFLEHHASVQRICFNGKTAEKLFRQRATIDLTDKHRTLEFQALPSTSPAYAAMSFADKLEIWSVIKRAPNVS